MFKILLNAEPFGFGPSAAIAEIFSIIKREFPEISLSYLGTGHDLDLQKNLPYDNFITWSENCDKYALFTQYDLFITAMDRNMASIAKQSGVKVLFYDALAWYWSDYSHLQNIDYYLYQAFLAQPEFPKNSFVEFVEIAPLGLNTSYVLKPNTQQEYALINFGGLQNFYWSEQVLEAYVKLILEGVYSELFSKFSKVIILGNSRIAQKFSNYGVITVSPEEAKALMQNSKITLATPGLGNIYDLANAGVNCIFLPPANDSQGQQLEILKQHGIVDKSLDWAEWGEKIDYFQVQPQVMENIKSQIFLRTPADFGNLMKTLVTESREANSICSLLSHFQHLCYNTLEVEIKKLIDKLSR